MEYGVWSMSKLNKRIIMSACSALVLSACGGGGSDEAKATQVIPVTPTLSLSLSESIITINENEQGVIGLSASYTGQSTIDYTISYTSEISGVTAVVVDNVLRISADELENEHVITLTLTASSTVDNISVEEFIEISLNNLSATTVIDEVELWSDVDSVFKFDDFENLSPLYAKSAYFNGAITKSEYQIKTEEFDILKSEAVNKKSSEENTLLSNSIADYQSNLITETELITLLNGVKTLTNNEYSKLAEKINELARLTDDALPLLSSESFGYVEEYGVFSGIIGAESMGTFTDDMWRFSEEYQFLETLIPALGINNECSAN
jgi:hypothetical protein